MKTKKLISLLCAAAMAASMAVVPASAADTSGSPLLNLDFNALDTKVLVDGTTANAATSTDVTGLTLVTTNRNGGDAGWYNDADGTEVKTGSYYSIEEKSTADKYLHMSYPMFGDYDKNSRHAHVDLDQEYTPDAAKDYVLEFDAKFTYGQIEGAAHDTTNDGKTDAVLRIGKEKNTVAVSKSDLSIGDNWVHVKSVTSTKGTKVYLDNAEVYSAESAAATVLKGFELYLKDGQATVTPPKDANKDNPLAADKHTLTPVVDIDNLKLYTADPEKEAEITIKYQDATGAAIPGKTDVTLTGIVGKKFTAPASYLVDIDAEGDNYYKYTSGNNEITINETATQNVITLVFTATPKPTVTFKAVSGTTELGTLGTAKAMPGQKVTATGYAQEYMQKDGKWYQKVAVNGGPRGNLPTYDLTANVGEADSTVNVQYTPAFNVVSFKEAESDEDTTDGTYSPNYPNLYASGGKWVQSADANAYSKGWITEPVTKAGTYEITVHSYSPNKRSGAICVLDTADTETKYAKFIDKLGADGVITTTVTAELEEGNVIWVGTNNEVASQIGTNTKITDDVDYIVVKDTSLDAKPTPVITATADKDSKTVSLTQDTDYDADVVVIHASYTAGKLASVEAKTATVAKKGDTATAVTFTGDFNTGDKIMVWSALSNPKPLLVTPVTVQ